LKYPTLGELRECHVDFVASKDKNHVSSNSYIAHMGGTKTSIFFVVDIFKRKYLSNKGKDCVCFYVNGNIHNLYYQTMGYFVRHTRVIK